MPAIEPPIDLPAGRILHVRGRGEFFVRDSGGDGPAVLLLHGWMFASDLNWWPVYAPLQDAGYRVLALDHRGHGRGLRTTEPFSLAACAGDAAAVVDALGCGPVLATGYSLGGPVGQLMARDHPETVAGLVQCATAREWQDPALKLLWTAMSVVRLGLNLFPTSAWHALLRAVGAPAGPRREWVAAELSRGSSLDIAEAGRELGRYDARPWAGHLDVPAAVVVTARDRSVPPAKQRELAGALRAPTFEVEADHLAVATHTERFTASLLEALASVHERGPSETARQAA